MPNVDSIWPSYDGIFEPTTIFKFPPYSGAAAFAEMAPNVNVAPNTATASFGAIPFIYSLLPRDETGLPQSL